MNAVGLSLQIKGANRNNLGQMGMKNRQCVVSPTSRKPTTFGKFVS